MHMLLCGLSPFMCSIKIHELTDLKEVYHIIDVDENKGQFMSGVLGVLLPGGGGGGGKGGGVGGGGGVCLSTAVYRR